MEETRPAQGGDQGAAGVAALGRQRFAESEHWFWRHSSFGGMAFAVLLACAVPVHGWLPFLLVGVPAGLGALPFMPRATLGERGYALTHAGWLVGVGVAAAASGGAQSFLLVLLAPSTLGFFSRLRPSSALRYAWGAFALAVTPVLVTDWAGFARSPWLVLGCTAGLVAIANIAVPMAASELRQRKSATIDQLTGLLNRRSLEDRFGELCDQAAIIGDDTPLALLAIDADEFKAINDAHGHQRGDDVLRDLAYTLRHGLRRFELAYRTGGEEFLILLPGHSSAEASALAEQLRRSIEASRPGGLQVTVSIGVAAAQAWEADLAVLVAEADTALFEAKRAGRNCVRTAPGPHAAG